MRENVLLVNRGLPQITLPPVEDREPRPELPLLSRTLSPEELRRLTLALQTPPASPGPAPPPGG